MKKFFAGIILGMIITLYIIQELGSGLIGGFPAKQSEIPLKEVRQNQTYKEKVGINDTTPDHSPLNNISKKSEPEKLVDDTNGPGNASRLIAATQIIAEIDSLPHYQMSLIGPAGKKNGKVLISSDSSVWCDLNSLSASMGWKLTNDGSVYSTTANKTLLFKFNVRDLSSVKNNLYISLSYLKKMWLLDFSFNPVNHTLELN